MINTIIIQNKDGNTAVIDLNSHMQSAVTSGCWDTAGQKENQNMDEVEDNSPVMRMKEPDRIFSVRLFYARFFSSSISL